VFAACRFFVFFVVAGILGKLPDRCQVLLGTGNSQLSGLFLARYLGNILCLWETYSLLRTTSCVQDFPDIGTGTGIVLQRREYSGTMKSMSIDDY
jgi:hypothetical protein